MRVKLREQSEKGAVQRRTGRKEASVLWETGSKRQSTCDVDTHDPTPNKWHCTLRTTIWNYFSLVLPFVESLFSLFQKLYECQLGVFWTINAFLAVDLKTNLVHYSRNLSKQMLRFCFYKYQTGPSTYMSVKPDFCCLLCTKHSPSTGHRQASLPKAYRATGNRDKTLAIHRFRKREPLWRKLWWQTTPQAWHLQSTLEVAVKKRAMRRWHLTSCSFLPASGDRIKQQRNREKVRGGPQTLNRNHRFEIC